MFARICPPTCTPTTCCLCSGSLACGSRLHSSKSSCSSISVRPVAIRTMCLHISCFFCRDPGAPNLLGSLGLPAQAGFPNAWLDANGSVPQHMRTASSANDRLPTAPLGGEVPMSNHPMDHWTLRHPGGMTGEIGSLRLGVIPVRVPLRFRPRRAVAVTTARNRRIRACAGACQRRSNGRSKGRIRNHASHQLSGWC